MKKVKAIINNYSQYSSFRNISLISVILLFSVLWSCDSNRIFEENASISDDGWNLKDKTSFTITIEDTLAPHNVYINVRHKSDYPWANIYLFLHTTYPNGEFSKDTIECILADDKGKWLGEGLGDLKSHQLMFMKNIRFKQAGNYCFEFQHAMRIDNLPGITNIGMRIEKVKK